MQNHLAAGCGMDPTPSPEWRTYVRKLLTTAAAASLMLGDVTGHPTGTASRG